MIRKATSNLWYYFVLCVFVILLATFFIMSLIVFIFIHLGVVTFYGPRFFFFILTVLFISVMVGTVISTLVGRIILKPVTALSKTTKAVAKGDFSIKLDESHRVKEIRELAVNFNKMVQELGSIETLRNDFVVNVSHEFKTPIAAIEGYATLLQDKDLTEEEKNEYTKMIIESARQLSNLSGNILKISKLENQEIIVEKDIFRLDEQVRQSLLLLEPKWSEKNMDLDIDLNPVTFYGNEELLMQVWLNLLGNAIKFTKNEGKISVTLKKADGWVTVTVSDNGIGMTEDVQKHIFEKFYQGDRTRNAEGNGLGLTLVKRIIDLCHGKIEVQSKYGEGATFTVKLPY